MKRLLWTNGLKIATIFIVFVTTLFAYSNDTKVYAYTSNSYLGELINTNNIKTTKGVLIDNKPVMNRKIASNYNSNTNNNYVVPRDSINIAGVLNRSLVKDNGSAFYLDHNINGVYDGIGVPFIDFRNDFNTRKTIIYGHSSMTGNGTFQGLQNYHNNYGFYSSHPYITINYNGRTYNYLIFSVYVSVANSEEDEGLAYFHRMNYSDSEWTYELNKYKSRSEYNTGVNVGASDKIVILQTCSMDPRYYEKYYRYNLLIMGKLV